MEHFIRHTLGCTCPPEVFANIVESRLPTGDAMGLTRRIAVGDRLLVYLALPKDAAQTASRLASWVRNGKTERDELGMNRFRLVIAVDDPEDVRAGLESRFSDLPHLDDKIHLHVVPRASIVDI
ncbi:MAG: hypothetical protein U9Q81_06125 [Pseudomonadota bacterium]|nr:hypothetical protein [Pseudomonadota bacterium]